MHYKVDMLVSIRTVVSHPSVNSETAAEVGKARVENILNEMISGEVISSYTTVGPLVTKLDSPTDNTISDRHL